MSMYSCCVVMYLHRASWHSSTTLAEDFSCFFLGYKANARVTPAKTGHGPHSSKFLCCSVYFVSFCVLFVCKCVLYYCHRMATQLQLANISYQNEVMVLGKPTGLNNPSCSHGTPHTNLSICNYLLHGAEAFLRS